MCTCCPRYCGCWTWYWRATGAIRPRSRLKVGALPLIFFPPEGGGRFDSRPPPLPTPAQVFEHVLLQIKISGKSAGAKGADFFFFAS